MTKIQKEKQNRKEDFIKACEYHGWVMNRWGALEKMKNGRSYRIKFKDRVARYEALAESGTWVRLGSANIADLRAYVDLDGQFKMSGFKR